MVTTMATGDGPGVAEAELLVERWDTCVRRGLEVRGWREHRGSWFHGVDLGQILQLPGVVVEAIRVENIDNPAPFHNYFV